MMEVSFEHDGRAAPIMGKLGTASASARAAPPLLREISLLLIRLTSASRTICVVVVPYYCSSFVGKATELLPRSSGTF